MTIKKLLKNSSTILSKISKSPNLELELLLSRAINKTKEFIYTYPEFNVQGGDLQKFNRLIKRRLNFEPIAYILGSKEFYGLDFIVNKNCLIPRPETEIMVHNALTIIEEIDSDTTRATDSGKKLIIDIGTGSGCIPISITKNLPKNSYQQTDILAIDISQKTLNTTKKNLTKYKLDKKIELLNNDLLSKNIKLEPLLSSKKYLNIIITANLPYIPTKAYTTIAKDIKNHEPKQALIAGVDGLKYYKKLFNQIEKLKTNDQELKITLLIEIEPEQVETIKNILNQNQIETVRDLQKNDRIMIIKF